MTAPLPPLPPAGAAARAADPGRVYGRGLAFPPRVGADGRLAWSEGPENVREGITLVLLTEPGERVELPAFGARLRAFLFAPNTVATRREVQEEILRALRRWEPRAIVQSVTVEADDADPRAAVATVRYELVATGAAAQVSVRVPLGG